MKRNLIIYILVITAVFILTSCTSQKEITKIPQSRTESNELFELTINTDSSEYSKKTPVECYATLKYIGDEPITIYHSDPLAVFIIENDKYFEDSGMRNAILINTTFEPNEEIKLEFQKSGGWSADDPNAKFYEEFYSEEDLILPKGEYTLSVNLEYSTDVNNIVETKQALASSIEITVK